MYTCMKNVYVFFFVLFNYVFNLDSVEFISVLMCIFPCKIQTSCENIENNTFIVNNQPDIKILLF